MRKTSFLLMFLCISLIILPAQQKGTNLPILTVLDFTVQGVSQVEMKTIISILSSSIFQMERFTVIDVSQRENILNEIEFSSSGCTDESCLLEIGKLLAAEMIVTGSLSKIGSRYVLSSKLLETQTGRTLGTADGMYVNLDALLDDISLFSQKLVKSVASPPKPAAEEGTVQIEEAPPAIAEEPPPAPEPDAVKPPKPPREPIVINWKKVGGITLTGVGAVSLGVGGYFIYNAFTAAQKAWLAYDTSTADQATIDNLYNDYLSVYEEQQPVFMYGLYIAGGGILAAGLGALLLLLPEKDSAAEVSAVLISGPKAPGILVSVRL